MVPIWVSEPNGFPLPAAGQLDAGDERRGDSAQAHTEDSKSALGRRDRPGGWSRH
jgi:hypothetical protein